MNKIPVMSQEIDNITERELLDEAKVAIEKQLYSSIATVNPEFLVLASHDNKFSQTLKAFTYRVVDGFGIAFLSQMFLRGRFKKRISGSDFVYDLLSLAQSHHFRILFFGASDEASKLAYEIIIKQYKGIEVCCISGGKIDPERVSDAIIRQLRDYRPQILIVGLGAPKQEYFIEKFQRKIGANVAIGAGGTIDFIAGIAIRAPKIFRFLGLEWLWRLVLYPKRWRRIFNATVVFPLLYVKWVIFKHI